MKINTVKRMVVALLVATTLWLAGCASAPQERRGEPQTTEQHAPSPAHPPAGENDDMERLD